MGRLILLAFLILPLAEIATLIWVGERLGILLTLVALVATAALGLLVLRLQGAALLLDSRAMLARGEIPARQVADGMLLAFAGALLVVPGFLTDIPGLLLLIPPVRAGIFALLSRHMVVVETGAPPGRREGPKTIELAPEDYRNE